jgi:ATP-dependent protease HslVU (ClpYQ) peptidase subunit
MRLSRSGLLSLVSRDFDSFGYISSVVPAMPCSASGDLDAAEIARRAMAIAADICVFTNANLVLESLEAETG